ncbi:hypothetical protein OF83DRAFT_1083346 [Amylostereum chailletii]|nr:hypothetical protein OF83DRAFT_1083346 [Amylostereum chailletii]
MSARNSFVGSSSAGSSQVTGTQAYRDLIHAQENMRARGTIEWANSSIEELAPIHKEALKNSRDMYSRDHQEPDVAPSFLKKRGVAATSKPPKARMPCPESEPLSKVAGILANPPKARKVTSNDVARREERAREQAIKEQKSTKVRSSKRRGVTKKRHDTIQTSTTSRVAEDSGSSQRLDIVRQVRNREIFRTESSSEIGPSAIGNSPSGRRLKPLQYGDTHQYHLVNGRHVSNREYMAHMPPIGSTKW